MKNPLYDCKTCGRKDCPNSIQAVYYEMYPEPCKCKIGRPKRISCGHYTYRGHKIVRHDGRGISNWRWVWEITDANGGACGHWQTMEMCVCDIDDYYEKGLVK